MTTPHAGWYPDPDPAGSGQRWWDGARWGEQVQAAPQQATPRQLAPQWGAGQPADQPWGDQPAQSWGGQPQAQQWTGAPQQPAAPTGFAQQNKFSLITAGLVALCVVIAATTDYIVFAFLPIVFAVQAAQRKEPLAWPAVGVAAALLIWRFVIV